MEIFQLADPSLIPEESPGSGLECSRRSASEFFFSQGASTIPREITAGARVITTNPDTAADLMLARGQYRVRALVPYSGDALVHDREIPIAIPYEDEAKRVYIYKLSLVPVDEVSPEGEPLGRLTIVFHVLDNVLPWALIGAAVLRGLPRALPWIAGSIGTWLVVDKVESFSTGSIVGAAVTIAASIGGLLVLWRTFGK